MQPTPLSQIKGKSTTEIQSPETGYVYRIRRLSVGDFHAAGLSSLFSGGQKKSDGPPALTPEMTDAMMPSIGPLIERGVVEPVISTNLEALNSQDRVHISEIGGIKEEMWLFGQLVEFSGLKNEAAQKDIEALSKNANGPSSLTALPVDTGDSPMKSSSLAPENSALRSSR